MEVIFFYAILEEISKKEVNKIPNSRWSGMESVFGSSYE